MFFFCHPGLDPGSRFPYSLSTRFDTFPGIPDLRFTRDDKGEELKEEQLLFLWGYLVVKGAQTTEVQGFRAFSGNTLQLSSSIE